MADIDTARLRALAEAAWEVETVGRDWWTSEEIEWNLDADVREAALMAAVNPPTLIALLDRLEAATAYVADPGNWSALDGRRRLLLAILNGEAPR